MPKSTKTVENTIETFCPSSRSEWRKWLTKNYSSKQSIWLIYYKKDAGKPSIAYTEAVDEALCFGWIDSKSKPIDADAYMQYFCQRKPNSVWSKVNKEKIIRLIKEGLMTQAGYDVIERAKANGSWTILDDAEALIVPPDLEEKLKSNETAQSYFEKLSRSDKRNILQWLVLAKQAATRQKRIEEIVILAAQEEKPKQFRSIKRT